jgi:Mn-containing catalase
MQDIRLAPQFFSAGGGALPMNSGGHSWNLDHITTTGNVVFDLLHNFHLECGARLHKLRVYETLTEPTGREVCGYLLVRGSVHAQRLRAGAEADHRRRRHQDTADAQHQPRPDSGGSEIHG